MVECGEKGHEVDKDATILEKAVSGMGMFVGDYTHSLDPKRRLTIPSVWRAQIGVPEIVYVLPDSQKSYLKLYTTSEMNRRLEMLRQQSITSADARESLRAIGKESELLVADSQGRIRIKDRLLSFASLKDRVIMIGTFDRIELWSPDKRSEQTAVDQAALKKADSHVEF